MRYLNVAVLSHQAALFVSFNKYQIIMAAHDIRSTRTSLRSLNKKEYVYTITNIIVPQLLFWIHLADIYMYQAAPAKTPESIYLCSTLHSDGIPY